MRLICPNCGAQYQIDADVIPEGGRDVQCSNCGHTWFERPGASEAAEEGFGAMETLAEPQETAETVATSAADTAFEDDDAPMDIERKPLDSSVADILKEEAAREQAARAADVEQEMPQATAAADAAAERAKELAAEAESKAAEEAAAAKAAAEEAAVTARAEAEARAAEAEAQEAADRAAAMKAEAEEKAAAAEAEAAEKAEAVEGETRSRIARLRGEEEAAIAAAGAAVAGSRKEQLPDIEEINSTLRSDSDRDQGAVASPESTKKKKGGFRFGFIFGLLLILLLVLLYIFSDQIIAAVPALEGAISSYVSMVDNLRLWLDDKMRGMAETIDPTVSEGDG